MSGRTCCRTLAVLAALFLSATNARAEDASAADAQKLAQALKATVDFNFNETPLTDVIKFLRDKQGIKTYLDEKSLRDANINLQSPITFKIKGISLRSALGFMLRELDLKSFPRDGVLWISTRHVADDAYETRVYAVRDLVVRPGFDPADTSQYDFYSLTDTIQIVITPSAWEASGPAPLEPMRHQGALVISATDEVHEQIADLLGMLRKVRDQQYAGGKPLPLAQRNLAPVLSRGASSPAIRKALAAPMSLGFEQKPLDEAITALAKEFDIPVLIDKKALREANVPLNTPVSLQAEGLSLQSGLNLLLRDLELMWVIHEEVLLVSTRDVMDELVEPRVYPALDLVDTPDSGLAAKPWSAFKRYDFSSLIDVIQNQIKPDSWCTGPGCIQRVPSCGAIVFAQLARVHDEAADLLTLLRQTRNDQMDGNKLKPLKERSLQPVPLHATSIKARLTLEQKGDFNELITVRAYPVSDLDEPERDWMAYRACFQADALKSSIEVNVRPDSWNTRHGFGSMDYVSNARTLVVTQSDEVHKEIEKLLAEIRRTRDKQGLVEVAARAIDPNDQTLHVKVYRVPYWIARSILITADDRMGRTGLGMAGMRGMGGGGMLPATDQSKVEALAELVKMITREIEPKSWQDAGGNGSVHTLEGRLVVRQTHKVHELIVRFLRSL